MLSTDFRYEIIRPVLEYLHPDIPFSYRAEELLMLTAAQESALGARLVQESGPALGVYQMEPATEEDIWRNFLAFHPRIAEKIKAMRAPAPTSRDLVGNLYYATGMARVHYFRVKEPLPDMNDVEGLARYWKKYYNTEKGKGVVEEAVRNYYRYVRR